jgi:hypothetical protein
MTPPVDAPQARHPSLAFTLDIERLHALVAAIAEEQSCSPDALTLDALPGEWLDEQLADLIDRAQGHEYQAIIPPVLSGHDVAIVAYAVEDGLIFAIRHDPLFYEHGAQIDTGWDEPAAFIPMRADGTDLDLAAFEGILRLVVDRANALLPVLAAACNVPPSTTRKEQP